MIRWRAWCWDASRSCAGRADMRPCPCDWQTEGPRPRADAAAPVLAVGGHLKNTVALAIGPQVFVSQHIGDLETLQSYEAFLRVISDFERLYEADPRTIAIRQPSRLPFDPICQDSSRPEGRRPGRFGATSCRPCPCLRRRKRTGAAGARRFLGRHGPRPGRNGLGRGVFRVDGKGVPSAWPICGSSDCPAASRPSRNRAGRRWGCSTSCLEKAHWTRAKQCLHLRW